MEDKDTPTMSAENMPSRNPTVEEWYAAGYTPTFPDDDGEEMRRVSSLVPVTQAELIERWNACGDMREALVLARDCMLGMGITPDDWLIAKMTAALSRAS
jgi:hypothetical protein